MKTCHQCGREEWLMASGFCWPCHGYILQRGPIATALAAAAFPHVQSIDQERADRYVKSADELIKALCRVRLPS